jgi:hypothetical protein
MIHELRQLLNQRVLLLLLFSFDRLAWPGSGVYSTHSLSQCHEIFDKNRR